MLNKNTNGRKLSLFPLENSTFYNPVFKSAFAKTIGMHWNIATPSFSTLENCVHLWKQDTLVLNIAIDSRVRCVWFAFSHHCWMGLFGYLYVLWNSVIG